jgi:hypothetical protein
MISTAPIFKSAVLLYSLAVTPRPRAVGLSQSLDQTTGAGQDHRGTPHRRIVESTPQRCAFRQHEYGSASREYESIYRQVG